MVLHGLAISFSELRLVPEVDGVLYMSHETILVGLAMRDVT